MRRTLHRWVGRHPLLGCALVAAAAVVAADGHPAAAAVALAALGLLVWSGRRRIALLAGLVAALAAGLHGWDVSQRESRRPPAGSATAYEGELRILAEPRPGGWRWSALAERSDRGGRVWLRGRGPLPRPGSRVAVRGSLRAVPAPRNPGEFDARPWLDRQGVVAQLRSRGPIREVEAPPAWRDFGQDLRAAFRESVTRGLDPLSREAAVIRAVVLGEHPDDDRLVEPFRRSGTLHVFAVSGLHVGMVGLLGWLAMRPLGVSRRAAVVPVVLLVFFYAWLTGMKPPAMRAAWMATVVLVALLLRRRPDLLNALGLAALIVILADGDRIFRAGVQLSFGVVLAIGILHALVSRVFAWMTRSEPYLPRSLYGPWRAGWLKCRRRVADTLAVSGSAWLGSAPLTGLYFGLFTPVAVAASSLMFLLVFPLLGLALASAGLSRVPGASAGLNRLNAGLAAATLRLADHSAALPGGSWTLPRGRPAPEFLLVYDLGAGGAACFRNDGVTALVDGGDRHGFEWTVLPSLRRMALEPGLLAATHPDGDHVGGLVEALEVLPVRQALLPVLRARSDYYRQLLDLAARDRVRMVRGRAGRRYPVGDGAALVPLLEPDPWNWHQLADERVMPLRLEWRGWRILFAADAGWRTERALRESGVDLRADVIVAGHHGYDGNLGTDFVRSTGARAIVVGHARFPASERVSESWRRACEEAGVAVFHQGESGAVTLTVDDDRLRIEGFVDGRRLELPAAGR